MIASKESRRFQSAKLLICEHYDSLIREIDIYTEEALEKLEGDESVNSSIIAKSDAFEAQTDFYGSDKRSIKQRYEVEEQEEDDDEFDPHKVEEVYTHKYVFDDDEHEKTLNPESETCGHREYLSGLRMRLINEVKGWQDYSLRFYEENRAQIDLSSSRNVDEMSSVIFADHFCFALRIDRFKHMEYGAFGNQSLYNLYIFILDFYLSPLEIDLLKYFLVHDPKQDPNKQEPEIYYDPKTLIVHLMSEYIFQKFSRNITNQKHTDIVIHINKSTLLEIKRAIFDHQITIKNVDLGLETRNNFDYSNLKSLDLVKLSCVRMTTTPYKVDLSSLRNLEYLCISDASIERDTLTGLVNVRVLFLIDCDLSSSGLEFLASVPNLECLEISDDWDSRGDQKEIREWTYNLDTMLSLTELKCLKTYYIDLAPNPIDLYKSLLDRLLVLEVKSSTLTQQFAESLFADAKSSTLLKLSFSLLTNFEDRNMIELRPEWFAGFTSLKSIDLSSNNIREIDSDRFPSLSSLERLNLSWNDIDIVQVGTFSALKELKTLNLSSNPLIDIEENALKCLEKLEELNLKETEITEKLNKSWFEGLNNLTKLNLSDNFLVDIDLDLFDHVPNLKDLNLSVNQVRLNGGAKFVNLKQLKVLDLSFNQLESIEAATFSGLSSLEELNLSSNHLTELNPAWFDGLVNLSLLDFSFNRLFWPTFKLDIVVEKLKFVKKINLFGNFAEEPLENLKAVMKFFDPRGLEVETYYKTKSK